MNTIGFLTKRGLADMLAVSPRYINYLMADRVIPHYRRGQVVRFKLDEVEQALNKLRVPAAGEPKRRMGRVGEVV